jgi:NAD(P)-dependent dehydrogenase (short-subunit alcohol dehydrogenase family)
MMPEQEPRMTRCPTELPVAVITGANRGIGLATAKRLGRNGLHVVLACRDTAKGEEAAAGLRQEGLSASSVWFDHATDGNPAQAAAHVAGVHGRCDVLVANAGIWNDWGIAPSALPIAALRETLEANLISAVAAANAFLPLLRAATQPRLVMVSSGLGSLARAAAHDSFACLAYQCSKAALNMAMLCYAHELRGTAAKVNACCPGWCRTALGGGQDAAQRSADDGADIIARLAMLAADGPTGGYVDDQGQTIPF